MIALSGWKWIPGNDAGPVLDALALGSVTRVWVINLSSSQVVIRVLCTTCNLWPFQSSSSSESWLSWPTGLAFETNRVHCPETKEKSFWSQNKFFIATKITVGVLIIMSGLTGTSALWRRTRECELWFGAGVSCRRFLSYVTCCCHAPQSTNIRGPGWSSEVHHWASSVMSVTLLCRQSFLRPPRSQPCASGEVNLGLKKVFCCLCQLPQLERCTRLYPVI